MQASPLRGDVYWVVFEPARGTEQAGRRPALIIQNDVGNQFAPYTVVAAITSAPLRKPYPFTVALAAGAGGLWRDGYVNCAQILTIDQSRLESRIGRLDAETMRRVDTALRYELAV